ncbi:TRAP transporter large permease [Synergistaceae bacterium OttesenSCG-928-I11]|nr:TRAP transporter large permease [Synergistaceae bacterium OttesenSCG-928-I11]
MFGLAEMTLLVFGALFVFMFMGLPVALSIEMSGVVFLLVTQLRPLIVTPQRIIVAMNSFPLLAIPLFVLMGYLMEKAGLSKRLVDWLMAACGKLPGALGTVTVVACAIFASLTGSGPATVAAIGTIMLPVMINEAGYQPRFAAGLVAAAGTLGPIIPPSITMVIYGATMNLSIPKMFVGAIIPGLFITGVLIAANLFITSKCNVKKIERNYTTKGFLILTYKALPTLCVPIIIMGGIYGGIFTPTEAASFGVAYTLLLGLCYKTVNLKILWDSLLKTVETSAMVGFLIGASGIFGWCLATARIPHNIANAIVPLLTGKIMYLIMLTMVLLVVGCLMETAAGIIVFAPILIPIGVALGLDELHLGVLFCINLLVGYVTPPFGHNLFATVSISGQSYEDVVRGVLPLMFLLIGCVLIFTFVPQLITWLPSLAFSK